MSELDNHYELADEPSRGFSFFNVLTVLVMLITALTAVCFVFIFLTPGLLPESFRPAEPQLQLISTAAPAPTMVPSATSVDLAEIPPTWTLSPPPSPIATATPRGTTTNTPTPSLTPTWHPTNTPTPTKTPTNTPTVTPTAGPSPTPSLTRSAFPFTLDRNSPQYIPNFANNAGCNWLGVAGQVFDLEGNPVPSGAYMIWVTEGGINYQTFTGGAQAYGPAGWEVYLHDRPRVATHRIQLFTPSGTPVSEVFEFSTWASCSQNLVIINFAQNH